MFATSNVSYLCERVGHSRSADAGYISVDLKPRAPIYRLYST